MPDLSSTQIENDIARLDVSLRQLKVRYDMFFAGALPREPFELRNQVEQLIKRYSNAPIRKYAHRFHLGTLVSRFNSLAELWGKSVREREEGPRGLQSVAPAQRDRAQDDRFRIRDPRSDQEQIRALHARFLEERQKTTGDAGNLPFESFLRQILARTDKIKQTAGCDHVELRIIVENNKVQLKARPGK